MANIAVNVDEYKAVATQGRNFTGKVAMVTGSGSGTGASIVKLLSALGAHVVVTGRDETLIHNVAAECQQMSPKNLKPFEVVADLTKTGDLKALITATITTFGRLDVLVNCETIAPFTDIWDTNLVKHFDETIAVDVRAILELTQLAVPHLEVTKGTVINMSSIIE
ncbi:unnamed protein product [Medioppia subpectinata]|uniref:Uncharacterized protein n=1 Tax=Medioppia subpectinata TaxID=1979941 RepID=A0A7R9L4U5_9ACAR|nr:unnamed protein product [Medioppia subpectinata]CAG2115368.1 unnamed protein product [Medioppia subpectinata]